MSEQQEPPLDLTPIRAQLDNGSMLFLKDQRALLAEVDRLRAHESYWQINHHAIRNDWTAAEKRAESAESRLAAIAALPEQWRRVANAVPAADEDYGRGLDDARIACASEVAALLQGQEPQK